MPKDGGIASALQKQAQSLLETGGSIKMLLMAHSSLKKAQYVALLTEQNLIVEPGFSYGSQSTKICDLTNSRRYVFHDLIAHLCHTTAKNVSIASTSLSSSRWDMML